MWVGGMCLLSPWVYATGPSWIGDTLRPFQLTLSLALVPKLSGHILMLSQEDPLATDPASVPSPTPRAVEVGPLEPPSHNHRVVIRQWHQLEPRHCVPIQ